MTSHEVLLIGGSSDGLLIRLEEPIPLAVMVDGDGSVVEVSETDAGVHYRLYELGDDGVMRYRLAAALTS